MKHRIFLFTILLTAFVLSSCDKFLDVKPTGKMIPTEAAELEKLLNSSSTYQLFFQDNNRGCSYAFLSDNIEISQNQETYLYGNSSPNMDRYASYVYYSPYLDPTISVHYFWDWGVYRPVGIFNNIIDGIDNLSDDQKNSEYAKGVIAQAKAARAFNYMTATIIYGPMWDPSGDNSARVIPYRTVASPAAPNPDLHTTEELFGFIEQDLDDALKDIPELTSSPVKANKAAVHAIRAQYYMYKRDWSNMLAEADAAWKAGGDNADKMIYDLNDFEYKYVGEDPQDGTDYEVALTLQYMPNIAEPFSDPKSKENVLYKECPSSAGAYPSESWLALFDRENDLRYKLFVLKYNGYSSGDNKDGIRLFNYRTSKIQGNAGITYPEVLLMRAEAYARTDQLSAALADLNTLRSYRYLKNEGDPADATDHPDGAALLGDRDKLIDEILTERRRELPMLSYKRTLDMKRYAYDAGKPWNQTVVVHKIGDKTYSKDISDKMAFTLPISNITISYNPHWELEAYTGTWNPMAN